MNKFIILILCTFLLFSFIQLSVADSGSFNVTNGTAGQNGTLAYPWTCDESGAEVILNVFYPYYSELNSPNLIQAWYKNEDNNIINATNTSVMLEYNNTYYNFTLYNNQYWYIYVSSSVEEDFNFSIIANSPSYKCINQTYLIKFMIPYYATFYFYKKSLNGTNSVEPYGHEFQYIYLQFLDKDKWNPLLSLPMFELQTLDKIFKYLPYYEASFTKSLDTTISFWTRYDNNKAIIKLYERGNYTINMLSTKLIGQNWQYEFYKPQFDSINFDEKISHDLELTNKSSGANTYYIYMSSWEISKSNFFFNIIKNLIYIAIWIGMLWGIFYLFPASMGVKIGGAIAITTLPILLKLLGVF